MKFGLILIAASVVAWGQVAVNGVGIVQTGLPPAQDNLLGPLIPSGNSPWIYGDLAEHGMANNMAPAALAETRRLERLFLEPSLGLQGTNVITTTSNLTGTSGGKILGRVSLEHY